jgi:tetratricopeptide (TPR) repeat protein
MKLHRSLWSSSVLLLACAHAPPIAIVDVPDEPTPEVVAQWEEASELFARLDREGRWDGEACHAALAAFERANVRAGGRLARAVYMAGLISARCGNDEGARNLYRTALELDPSLCEARVAIGVEHMAAGRLRIAQESFEEAIARDGRCATGYVNLAILQTETPSLREEALANLRRALAVQADDLRALDQIARIYLAESENAPQLLDLAEVVCRQAQLLDPDYAPIYNTWGLIDVAQGELTSAVAKFARATELDPRLFAAHMNFGQITLSQRAYEDAARAFARAHELRPESYDAAVGLGVARRGLRDPSRAEQAYRAAIEIDADRPEAYFDLAVLYQEHRDGSVEDFTQAEAFLRQFVERARREARFSDEVQEALRWCEETPRRGRRASCRPGRALVLHQTLVLLGAREERARPAWLDR